MLLLHTMFIYYNEQSITCEKGSSLEICEVEKMKPRTLNNELLGVSAVIGVILMVAITVALAATVYYYINKNLPSTTEYIPKMIVINPDKTSEVLRCLKGDLKADTDKIKVVYNGQSYSADLVGKGVAAGDEIHVGDILNDNVPMDAGVTYTVQLVYDNHVIGSYDFENMVTNTPSAPPAVAGIDHQISFSDYSPPAYNAGEYETVTLEVKVTDSLDHGISSVSFYGGMDAFLQFIGTTNVNSGDTATIEWSGLSLDTTYYWNVVVTCDGGGTTESLTVTSPTQQFTTHINSPPVIDTPNPADGAVNVNPLDLDCSYHIWDPDGDLMSYSIACSDGEGIGDTHATFTYPDGTYGFTLKNLKYDTTYTMTVDAVEAGSLETTETFTFTTISASNPVAPVFSNIFPADGAKNVQTTTTIRVTISDAEKFSYRIDCSNGASVSNPSTPTGIYTLNVINLKQGTVYTFTVTATSPTGTTTQTCSFTTTSSIVG